MDDSAPNPQAVSPRWLWGLRLATVVAGLPLSIAAGLILNDLHRIWKGHPLTDGRVQALGLGVVILVSAVISYVCILWHTRRNPPQENGRVWAMGTGSTWLVLCAALALFPRADQSFPRDPDFPDLVLWLAILWPVVGLPHAGIITCAIKAYSPTTPGPTSALADGEVHLGTKVLQVATGITVLFLLFPYLYFSGPQWQFLHWRAIALMCLMVLCAEVPYVFI